MAKGDALSLHHPINHAAPLLTAKAVPEILPRINPQLDFIQSGRVTERVGQAVKERARDLYEVIVFLGQ